MIALLLNHLWQSSLCLAGAGLLALALRHNGANVRFWLWFAASVKFLLPFAVLTALGTYYLKPIVPPQPAVALIEPLTKPFSATSLAVTMPLPAPAIVLTTANPAPAVLDLESVLLALWLAGFLIVTLRWLVCWSRLRALLREAVAFKADAPIAAKFSASLLEPGLAGIFRPVILLPSGIEQQLSAVELKAVLAHELCHWRRHDNLLASIHMLVEALFWFFPLVWWLGARLNAERERACDESVLAEGNDPQEYAEGILKVCRAYLQSPLACVAGVSGGGLKKRIDAIMENRLIPRLNAARKLLLSASAALVIAVPLALGLATVPVAEIQAKAAQILTPIAQTPATASAALNEPAPSQTTASPPVIQPESLAPPSPDLPAFPNEPLATPIVVASAGPPNKQPAAATPDGSTGAATGLSPPAAATSTDQVRGYDKAAVPSASAALEKAQQDCKARLAAKEIQTYSEFAACSLAAEHTFFTAIKLKKMDVFEAYADSYQALAADRDARRVSDRQAGHRVNNILSRFYRHCNCEARQRSGFGAVPGASEPYSQSNYSNPSSNSNPSNPFPSVPPQQ